MPEGAKAASSRPYSIFETHQFSADLVGLGPANRRRIEGKLRQYIYPLLRQNPHFGPNLRRLKNWDPPTWRYRVGDWRFFYEIDEQERIVLIIAADHRKEAYRSS